MTHIRFGEFKNLRAIKSTVFLVLLFFSLIFGGTVSAASYQVQMMLNSDDVKRMAATLRQHPELLRDIHLIQLACEVSRKSPYFKFSKARAYFLDEFAKTSGSADLEDKDVPLH